MSVAVFPSSYLTPSDTAKIRITLHWQDHLVCCPGDLWIPWHEQAAWPENTIPQGESPVAGLCIYFFQLELNKQQ